ncbi:MAG: hypothetical protein ABF586_06705 [Sporolactobacillus sp.]
MYLVHFSLSRFFVPFVAVGVSLICFAIFPQMSSEPDQQIAAYVTMDWDANMETAINHKGQVIAVRKGRGMNLYGKQVSRPVPFSTFSSKWLAHLDRHSPKGKPLYDLMTISYSSHLTAGQRRQLSHRLVGELEQAWRKQMLAVRPQVHWLTTTMASRSEAEQLDLSVGRYLLYKRALIAGKPLTIEQARQFSPKQLANAQSSTLSSEQAVHELRLDGSTVIIKQQ